MQCVLGKYFTLQYDGSTALTQKTLHVGSDNFKERQAKGKNKLQQFKWKIEEDWFVLSNVFHRRHTAMQQFTQN